MLRGTIIGRCGRPGVADKRNEPRRGGCVPRTHALEDGTARHGDRTAFAHWHFFASSASNTIGADERVLDLLDQLGGP